MSRSVLTVLVATITLAAVTFPSTSVAQSSDGGVQVDPNSPAGTEYDIPIARARRDAQGDDKKQSGKDSLFGQGVKSDAQSAEDAAGTDATTEAKKKHPQTAKAKKKKQAAVIAAGSSDPPGADPVAFNAGTASDQATGSGSLLAIGAITLAIVAVAALGGWAVRRRSL